VLEGLHVLRASANTLVGLKHTLNSNTSERVN
jgi:hypothetical protein